MREIFLGPLRHWLIFAAVLAVLWVMGANQFHITDFKLFLLVLFALAVAALGTIVLSYRPGERITREPLDEKD